MATKTDVEFKVTADTSQAQAAVGGLEDVFIKSTGAVAQLDKRMSMLTIDMHELSDAILSGKGNTAAYRAELQRLERQMDALEGTANNTASAVARVDDAASKTAKSTRNGGQMALEASRAFEDLQYGIGGVINNVPGFLQAFGAGAGLTGVVAAGTVVLWKAGSAVIGLYEEMEAANRINTEWNKGLEKVTGHLRDRFTVAVNDAQAAVRDAAKELRQFGMDSNETRADNVRAAIEFQKSRVAAIDADSPARQKRVAEARALLEKEQQRQIKLTAERRFQLKEAIEVEGEVLKQSKQNRDAAIKSIKEEEKALADLEKIKAATDEKEKEREAAEKAKRDAERSGKDAITAEKKAAEDLAKARYDVFIAGLDAEDKALAEHRKAARERDQREREEDAKALAEDFKFFDKEREAAEKEADKRAKERARERQRQAERGERRTGQLQGTGVADSLAFGAIANDPEVARIDAITDHEFAQLKARRDAWAGFYGEIGQLGTNTFGMLVNETADLFNSMAAGEEKAVERFAVNVMKNAGQSLVASGTKLAGESVVSFLTPGLQPLGAAQLAGAVGLVGAGVGLGASAGALSGVFGLAGGGLPDSSSARDPGASPRSSGGDGGGGLVVNISYGVTGPLPEDTARAVREALEVGDRR